MVKSKFAINIHILVLLSKFRDNWINSNFIAGSLNVNPVLVRKEIIELKKIGLVVSKEGKNGGVQLAKPPEQILLSDILEIVNEDHVFGFAKNDPNKRCPVGKQIKERLDDLFVQIDKEVEKKLKSITLKDFQKTFK
jgi:Rrf2 family protein